MEEWGEYKALGCSCADADRCGVLSNSHALFHVWQKEDGEAMIVKGSEDVKRSEEPIKGAEALSSLQWKLTDDYLWSGWVEGVVFADVNLFQALQT